MSEMAKYNGATVKIGTCEDMYYLRADQAHKVRAVPHSLDPVRDAGSIRFRFPFPDEDQIEPGSFERFDRSVNIPGISVPADIEHRSVQFRATPGYLLSIPCPESGGAAQGLSAEVGGLTVARNGFAGAVHISQQRLIDGKLVLVCRCGGCGVAYRLEDPTEAKVVADACEARAERERFDARLRNDPGAESAGAWWSEIAHRILAGYTAPNPWTAKGGK